MKMFLGFVMVILSMPIFIFGLHLMRLGIENGCLIYMLSSLAVIIVALLVGTTGGDTIGKEDASKVCDGGGV